MTTKCAATEEADQVGICLTSYNANDSPLLYVIQVDIIHNTS